VNITLVHRLRAVADFLEQRPDLPPISFGVTSDSTTLSGQPWSSDDTERLEIVRRVAGILGLDVVVSEPHAGIERTWRSHDVVIPFDGFELRIYAHETVGEVQA